MMLTGLIPFVYYELRVTADNGVSSQDNNINVRTVTISIMTKGGGNYYSWNTLCDSLCVCLSMYMCVCVSYTCVCVCVCVICVCVLVSMCVCACVCACLANDSTPCL